jgi:hypothetical protein
MEATGSGSGAIPSILSAKTDTEKVRKFLRLPPELFEILVLISL